MSVYSELLQKYISEKDIKVSDLIQYCEVDRSFMYKIINGKRKLTSVAMARKIANFMKLSPKECESYYSAYYQTKCGDVIFRQNEQIRDFICNFTPGVQRPVFMEGKKMTVMLSDDHPIHMLKGKLEIDYHMKMLLEQTAQKENQKIRLMVQNDHTFLIDMLLSLGKNTPGMVIQHILCFQREEEKSGDNLNMLQEFLAFYGCKCQYEPYYYYDRIESHFYNMNLFCNCVICEEGVLSYTSDYAYGQLICDRESIEVYKQIFEQYRQQTYPLLRKIDSIIQEYMLIGQSVLGSAGQSVVYSIHSEPCVVPFINDRILKKQVREMMPQRENSLQIFHQYIEQERKILDQGQFNSFFTLQGIEHFIENGKVGEIPDDFYDPLDQEDCLSIIHEMLPYFENGSYRILKDRLAMISRELYIFVAPFTGHFLLADHRNHLIYIDMKEPGMIRQFYQFIESLNEDMSLYTGQEAVKLVRQILKKYAD